MAEEIKFEKKKQGWTVGRIFTTVIIVVLALLMIGGLSYAIVFYKQGHDETNVYGYYDGKAIRLENNSVFANSILNNSNYVNAVLSNDISSLMSIYYEGFRSAVTVQAMNDMAEKAGVITTDTLVDRMIIKNGTYSGGGDSSFDEEYYKSKTVADRKAVYDFNKALFPANVMNEDLQTTLVGEPEADFVSSLTTDTRSFEYFAVDYNVLPDYIAQEYDISDMYIQKDQDGNDIEPTLSEIKAYIADKEPDLIAPYLEFNNAMAEDLFKKDFKTAGEKYGNGVVAVEDAANNIGNSSVILNGYNMIDEQGYLAKIMDEERVKEFYNAEAGYTVGPISTSDNANVYIRVTSTEPSDSWKSFTQSMFTSYYAGQDIVTALTDEIFASSKMKDNFTAKFVSNYLTNL